MLMGTIPPLYNNALSYVLVSMAQWSKEHEKWCFWHKCRFESHCGEKKTFVVVCRGVGHLTHGFPVQFRAKAFKVFDSSGSSIGWMTRVNVCTVIQINKSGPAFNWEGWQSNNQNITYSFVWNDKSKNVVDHIFGQSLWLNTWHI